MRMVSEVCRILVAAGSFKDVFPPAEACAVIRLALERAAHGLLPVRIETVPLADGGEHSAGVLAALGAAREVRVGKVAGPMGEPRDGSYLLLDDGSVFVDSSLTSRLMVENTASRNPLLLTSYGVGQVLRQALAQHPHHVYLSLGGSSTADGGIGLAQALGVEFLDSDGRPLAPARGPYLTGADLPRVADIRAGGPCAAWRKTSLDVLWDGEISVRQIAGPTRLKIGRAFAADQGRILSTVEDALLRYCETVARALRHRDLRWPVGRDLSTEPAFGAAGGMLLSLVLLFDVRPGSGAAFFAARARLEERIGSADLVVSGEGRFDNTLSGKSPVMVSRLARRHGKSVLILCGAVEPDLDPWFDGALSRALPPSLREAGISRMVRCLGPEPPGLEAERLQAYRQRTPAALTEGLRRHFLELQKGV
jgi:glycerate 2-kinase